MQRVIDRVDDSIPSVLYIISDILEEVLDQLDQADYQMPEKLKALFLLYNQNDERYKLLSSRGGDNLKGINLSAKQMSGTVSSDSSNGSSKELKNNHSS